MRVSLQVHQSSGGLPGSPRDLIAKIVDRASATLMVGDTATNDVIVLIRMSLHMDITAAHVNGCPLRLAEWLEADDFNFAHDIAGIVRHIDRDTGKIGGLFLPRFAA